MNSFQKGRYVCAIGPVASIRNVHIWADEVMTALWDPKSIKQFVFPTARTYQLTLNHVTILVQYSINDSHIFFVIGV
jgi:hypothetical protein